MGQMGMAARNGRPTTTNGPWALATACLPT